MFCSKCGANNEDQSLFCSVCGEQLTAPVEEEIPVEAAAEAENETVEIQEAAPVLPQRRKKKSKKGLWIGAGAAGGVIAITAVVMSIVLVFTLFSGILIACCFNTPKSVANGYLKAALKPNTKKMLSYVVDEMVDDFLDDTSISPRELYKRDNEAINEVYDDLDETYRHWKISYDILYIEDCPKDVLKLEQQ